MANKTNFIFFFGSVLSSIGKGVTSSAVALSLLDKGFKVKMKKLDPYLNIDPGTMSPDEHGEVFITDEGLETDLDLGHYERMGMQKCDTLSNITGGAILKSLLQSEREGAFLGKTVQFAPHCSNAIADFIEKGSEEYDFVLTEIGGTIGDDELRPFLKASKEIELRNPGRSVNVVLTFVAFMNAIKEFKTKPAQMAMNDFLLAGLKPEIIVCRSEKEIDEKVINKLSMAYSISPQNIIPAHDSKNPYAIPYNYDQRGLTKQIFKALKIGEEVTEINNIANKLKPELQKYKTELQQIAQNIAQNLPQPKSLGLLQKMQSFAQQFEDSQKSDSEITIAIISKYNSRDSYKSIIESFNHAQTVLQTKVNLKVIDGNEIESDEEASKQLQNIHGILVPGGFGKSRTEGKIKAIRYARENKIPFFGICLGMQLSVIEFCRNVLNIKNASSTEFESNLTEEEKVVDQIIKTTSNEAQILGGNMRLGAYTSTIKEGTLAHKVYQDSVFSERHRHRYEVKYSLLPQLEKHNATFSAISAEGSLPEIFEIKDHPYFISCQFHPEIKSRPFSPSKLFTSFVEAAAKYKTSLK